MRARESAVEVDAVERGVRATDNARRRRLRPTRTHASRSVISRFVYRGYTCACVWSSHPRMRAFLRRRLGGDGGVTRRRRRVPARAPTTISHVRAHTALDTFSPRYFNNAARRRRTILEIGLHRAQERNRLSNRLRLGAFAALQSIARRPMSCLAYSTTPRAGRPSRQPLGINPREISGAVMRPTNVGFIVPMPKASSRNTRRRLRTSICFARPIVANPSCRRDTTPRWVRVGVLAMSTRAGVVQRRDARRLVATETVDDAGVVGADSSAIHSANFAKSWRSRLGRTAREMFGRLNVTTNDRAVLVIFNIFLTSARTPASPVARGIDRSVWIVSRTSAPCNLDGNRVPTTTRSAPRR